MIEKITQYPYKLEPFKNSYKYIILEDDYYLYYGKRQTSSGKFELFASINQRYYPHDVIINGDKPELKVYKIGALEPSATWELPHNNKKIYLFISNTTPYVSDKETLGEAELADFDSSDIELDTGLIENYKNIFDIISESGAYFNPLVTYRQYAFVKSQKNGKLYIKTTEEFSIPSEEQLDPALDSKNWTLLIKDVETNGNFNNYVDVTSNQIIHGTKTFESIFKEEVSTKPSALELLSYNEASNLFLSINGTAENSKLLDKSPANELSVPGSQVIVKTNNNGKIDDSFLNAPIVANPLVVTVNVAKADNKTIFSTIQSAFQAVAKMIRQAPVTIKVEDGTYYNDNDVAPIMNLVEAYDCSNIQIIGNIDNPENCILRINSAQTGIFFSGKGIYINGFKIIQQGSDKGTSVGIKLDYGCSIIFGQSIIIENCKYGLVASNLSFANCDYMQCNDCDIAFSADNSTLNLYNSKTQSCNISYVAENNATIYATSAVCDKGHVQTNDTIGFIASYNSIIKAEHTVETTSSLDKPYNDEITDIPNKTNGIIKFS